MDHDRARAVAERLRFSPSVTFVRVEEADFDAAWEWFDRYRDKDFSFTDCASFAVMKRLRVKTALTFDRHFTQAGFEQKP